MPVRRTSRRPTSRRRNTTRTTTRRTNYANGKPWSPTEVKTLRKIYKDTPTKDIAKKFKRSVSSVQAKAGDLGLRKNKTYLKKMRQNQWR